MQWIRMSSYTENGLVIQHYKVCIFTEDLFIFSHSQDVILLILQEKKSHGKINDDAFLPFF